MKHLFLVIYFFHGFVACSQHIPLKSARHGLDLVFSKRMTKDSVIADVTFENGKDDFVDILRFDNVGTGRGPEPFILSSKPAIASDELGLISSTLQRDSLASLLGLIDSMNTKIEKRISSEGFCFRVTYRYNQSIIQYFISTKESATDIFKAVEGRLIRIGDNECLNSFYKFLYGTRLIEKTSSASIRWKY
jgi:hypothetical protein